METTIQQQNSLNGISFKIIQSDKTKKQKECCDIKSELACPGAHLCFLCVRGPFEPKVLRTTPKGRSHFSCMHDTLTTSFI